ncbi:MAG: hypothetical protein ACE5FA_06980 [Dehalococcoidia bacterium]
MARRAIARDTRSTLGWSMSDRVEVMQQAIDFGRQGLQQLAIDASAPAPVQQFTTGERVGSMIEVMS